MTSASVQHREIVNNISGLDAPQVDIFWTNPEKKDYRSCAKIDGILVKMPEWSNGTACFGGERLEVALKDKRLVQFTVTRDGSATPYYVDRDLSLRKKAVPGEFPEYEAGYILSKCIPKEVTEEEAVQKVAPLAKSGKKYDRFDVAYNQFGIAVFADSDFYWAAPHQDQVELIAATTDRFSSEWPPGCSTNREEQILVTSSDAFIEFRSDWTRIYDLENPARAMHLNGMRAQNISRLFRHMITACK